MPSSQHFWSQWEQDALFTTPVEDLKALHPDRTFNHHHDYIPLLELSDPARADRARQAREKDLGLKDLIEADDLDLDHMISLRASLAGKNQAVPRVLALARRGVTTGT